MADESGGIVAGAAGAAKKVADTVANWPPGKAIQTMFVLLLSFLCVVFAAQLWAAQERDKARDRDIRERDAALIREFNAQAELIRVGCEYTREKDKRTAEEKEARLLATFAAEREKDRQFWAAEADKNRREFLAHLKTGGGP